MVKEKKTYYSNEEDYVGLDDLRIWAVAWFVGMMKENPSKDPDAFKARALEKIYDFDPETVAQQSVKKSLKDAHLMRRSGGKRSPRFSNPLKSAYAMMVLADSIPAQLLGGEIDCYRNGAKHLRAKEKQSIELAFQENAGEVKTVLHMRWNAVANEAIELMKSNPRAFVDAFIFGRAITD